MKPKFRLARCPAGAAWASIRAIGKDPIVAKGFNRGTPSCSVAGVVVDVAIIDGDDAAVAGAYTIRAVVVNGRMANSENADASGIRERPIAGVA